MKQNIIIFQSVTQLSEVLFFFSILHFLCVEEFNVHFLLLFVKMVSIVLNQKTISNQF